MTTEIFNQVRGIAADLFQMAPAGITAESSPESIDAWDSVQHLNLVLALEQQFDVQFEPDEMDRMKTVGQIAAMLGQKLGRA